MSLLHAIEICLRISRIPPSRFGRDSVRDPRLVHDLRRGRQPGRRVEQRVRNHIEILLQAAAMRSAQGANPTSRQTMPRRDG
jgi:hypothetical protein